MLCLNGALELLVSTLTFINISATNGCNDSNPHLRCHFLFLSQEHIDSRKKSHWLCVMSVLTTQVSVSHYFPIFILHSLL